MKKGHTYGTLLCDLERHQVIELWEGRDGDPLAKWLKEHPGVEIITRDRASAYAEGAREGAPDAIQVADRFHLSAKLGQSLAHALRATATGPEITVVRGRQRKSRSTSSG